MTARDDYFAVKFENDALVFLDQTKVPLTEEYVETDDVERIAEAIVRLEVRGAPQLGVVGAYGFALGLKRDASEAAAERAYRRLVETRPTAVNLKWALDRAMEEYRRGPEENAYERLVAFASELHRDDAEKCRRIGENGLAIFKKRSTALTHCNTGKLATGGDGTAFAVLKTAHERGMLEYVYADETRPLLQGSRLTAYELDKVGVPFSILADNAAATLFQRGEIDLVVVGADRIAANGDAANKIGTYNLAVLCAHHDVPFYIAAPTSTIDASIATGAEIPIERRDGEEVRTFRGTRVADERYDAYNPAFDVTPAELIAGIATERKLHEPPFRFNR